MSDLSLQHEETLRQKHELLLKMKAYKRENPIEFFTKPNPPQRLLLDAWDNPCYKVFVMCGGNRLGKCLGAETLIYDPIKNESIPVGDIKDSFHVYAWNGERLVVSKADKPFIKVDKEPIYRIELSNGGSFTASGGHRVLTPSGYLSISELHQESSVFLPQTNSDAYPLTPLLLDSASYPIITSIKYLREDVKYDFNVPIYHNYYAEGAIHHNTTMATLLGISTMLGFYPWSKKKLEFKHTLPRKVRLVGQDWEKHIQQVTIPELRRWFPKARKLYTKKNTMGVESFWQDMETGSTLEIMSNKQESDLHEGWNGDLVIYDEPPRREIRVANSRGLVDRNGRELFCMTLLKESWIDRDVIKALDADGNPDKTVFVCTGDIYANVGYGLTLEGVKQFEKTLTDDEKQARLFGIPAYMSGLVYPMFNRKTHLRDRFKIPLDWIVDIAIDVHPRKQQAVLFVATAPDNRKYVCDEIWMHCDGKALAEEIVRYVKRNAYNVENIIIDPSAKGDSNNVNTVYDKIQDVLARYELPLAMASKDMTSGILAVKSFLKTPNGESALFFFDDLKTTLSEIEGYVYEDQSQKPKDENDHMLENLRRILLLDTKYKDPSVYFDDDKDIKKGNYMTGY